MDLDQLDKLKKNTINKYSGHTGKEALNELEESLDAITLHNDPNQTGYFQSHLQVIKCIGQLKSTNHPIWTGYLERAMSLLEQLCAQIDPNAKKPHVINKLHAVIKGFEQNRKKYKDTENRKINGIHRLEIEDDLYLQMYQQANEILNLSLTIFLILEGWRYLLAQGPCSNRVHFILSYFSKSSSFPIKEVERLSEALRIAHQQAFAIESVYPNIEDERFKTIFKKIYKSLPSHPENSLFRSVIDKNSADDLYYNISHEKDEVPDHQILDFFLQKLTQNFFIELIYLTNPDAITRLINFGEYADNKSNEKFPDPDDMVHIANQKYQIVCLRLSANRWIVNYERMGWLLENHDSKFQGCLLFATAKTDDDRYFVRFTNFIPKGELRLLLRSRKTDIGWVSIDLAEIVKIDRRHSFFTEALDLSVESVMETAQSGQVRRPLVNYPILKNFKRWLTKWREQASSWFRPKILVPAAIGLLLLIVVPSYILYEKPLKNPYLSIIPYNQGIHVRGQNNSKIIEFSNSGNTLKSGDRFQLKVNLQRSKKIMILYKDPKGKVSIINSEDKGKGTYIFPSADDYFVLDDYTGIESFFLILCDKCIYKESEIIKHVEQGTINSFVSENLNGILKEISFEHK